MITRMLSDRTHAVRLFTLALSLLGTAACATTTAPTPSASSAAAPRPDPRVGLHAGLHNAGEAAWNLRVLSKTPSPPDFANETNSDLAFIGNYAIQGNYHGILFWDISNPQRPTLAKSLVCPATQNDVSVYRNLLFVSSEGLGARLDCGTQGVDDPVSAQRIRGIRIFDISDIRNPKYIANVQTCRGSHTHTLLVDPRDTQNVYVYISGSSPPRPAAEMPGCIDAPPSQDPNSALFRIEVIRVPLANPERAAIVATPRIFSDLPAPPLHGLAPDDRAELARARARGAFVAEMFGEVIVAPDDWVAEQLAAVVRARGGTGAPTAADSALLRRELPRIFAQMFGVPVDPTGPTQCHDITVYPAIGLAGGACEGYGMLLDISDPANPRRLAAVADSNFAYWHSATFNNDGTKILFSDEWGGGGGAKCRATDPKEWGADAIFTIENRQLRFASYFKLPAVQTPVENCVAHNGSIIPIPGRDVMVQAWYQGGINVFDFTDARRPYEIAFFDRGPIDAREMGNAGSWSVYWYNGVIVSSEIGRGLDILELTPSAHITQNEIDAAKSVKLDYFNAQGQPKYVWPATFALARAYIDQLERSGGLTATRITSLRQAVTAAEAQSGSARQQELAALATQLDADVGGSGDAGRIRLLAASLRDLGAAR